MGAWRREAVALPGGPWQRGSAWWLIEAISMTQAAMAPLPEAAPFPCAGPGQARKTRACLLHKTFRKVPEHSRRMLPSCGVRTRTGRGQASLTWRESMPKARTETQFCPQKWPVCPRDIFIYFQAGAAGHSLHLEQRWDSSPARGTPWGPLSSMGPAGSVSPGGGAGLLSRGQGGDSTY